MQSKIMSGAPIVRQRKSTSEALLASYERTPHDHILIRKIMNVARNQTDFDRMLSFYDRVLFHNSHDPDTMNVFFALVGKLESGGKREKYVRLLVKYYGDDVRYTALLLKKIWSVHSEVLCVPENMSGPFHAAVAGLLNPRYEPDATDAPRFYCYGLEHGFSLYPQRYIYIYRDHDLLECIAAVAEHRKTCAMCGDALFAIFRRNETTSPELALRAFTLILDHAPAELKERVVPLAMTMVRNRFSTDVPFRLRWYAEILARDPDNSLVFRAITKMLQDTSNRYRTLKLELQGTARWGKVREELLVDKEHIITALLRYRRTNGILPAIEEHILTDHDDEPTLILELFALQLNLSSDTVHLVRYMMGAVQEHPVAAPGFLDAFHELLLHYAKGPQTVQVLNEIRSRAHHTYKGLTEKLSVYGAILRFDPDNEHVPVTVYKIYGNASFEEQEAIRAFLDHAAFERSFIEKKLLSPAWHFQKLMGRDIDGPWELPGGRSPGL